ncbi:MAG: hypothetical protein LBQ97_00050 [Fusobacteriaceae bacterium]|jgi:hypothetical protein|nr:hypothetical protein [Fusobacteriaceae bacterium]
MMYPFMSMSDGTEVVHSDVIMNSGKEEVKVYFEKPIPGGFQSAMCLIPSYKWTEVSGYSQNDLMALLDYLKTVAHVIIRLAREGGFENAANL